MNDEDFLPAPDEADEDRLLYFQRLSRADKKAWLAEETAMRDKYGLKRMSDDSYKALDCFAVGAAKDAVVSRDKQIKDVMSYDPLLEY